MAAKPSTMRTCIVAFGARTPVGLRATSSAAAVRAGITRLREHPYMVDKAGDPFVVCMDGTITATSRRERMYALAASALDEVLEGVPTDKRQKLPIFLGLPEPSATFSREDGTRLCQRITAHVLDRCDPQVVAVLEGNAAAIAALSQATDAIAKGVTECCIVGGVDSLIDPDVLEPLDADKRIKSVSNRWGFPPGEGAAMFAVCTATFARGHRLPIKAYIASVVNTREPNRMHTETICTGEGLGLALTQAARQAGTTITKQFCDIDGERYREHELSFAILRVPSVAFENAVDYVAPADCWGNTGAATGAMLTMLPVLQHERGASPGAWPMVWCGSENGRRGALVLHLEGARAS